MRIINAEVSMGFLDMSIEEEKRGKTPTGGYSIINCPMDQCTKWMVFKPFCQ